MSSITRFKNVGGLGVKFFQRRNYDNIYKWLKANPEHIFESHHTPTWIEDMDPRKENRLAGQTRGELDIILSHRIPSPNPLQWTPFGEIKEMLLDNDRALEGLRREFPRQVRLFKINQIILDSWNREEQKVVWRYHDINHGWNVEEVDLRTSLILDGLKTGNYDPDDDFKEVYEIQEFFQDKKLYEYYAKMDFTSKERKLPILCRGGGLGALQVGEEDAKIIFADQIKFTPDDIHNNDRMSDMRKKYLAMPDGEKKWSDLIFPVAPLLKFRKLGRSTELIDNLFGYIEKNYPNFPDELLHRLGVSFNQDDGTVKLLAVMVRSYGYKKQNALPGLEHPNYRNVQPFGDTTGFKTIAPTNLVGSFVEQVTNADLFVYDQKLFDLTFAKANNTHYFMYRPQVQFQIRQMIRDLKIPGKELLQYLDTDEFWTLLDKEINTKFRSLTDVPTTTLERQLILFEVYKQCTPVALLLKEKPDLEVQLKLLFMTFAIEFQG